MVGKSLIKKFRAKEIKVVECLPSSASNHRDSLSKRCRAANYGKVDVFLSIHHNACPGGYGSECLCIKGGQRNALSERLSKVILEEVCKLGLRNRGVKDRRDLYVINNTTMPAIIVECAFVDSARDMKGYDTEKMAEAIFRGVCRFYGISLNSGQGELGGVSVSGSGENLGGISSSGNHGGTSSLKYHLVQKGDTLWGISRKYGVSVDKLVERNGIKDKGQQNALSERLSKDILEEVCKLGLRNRGVKDRRDLYVINNTTMPAIIVECAFVDSNRDMNGYDSEKVAEAIFKGVCKFYGIDLSGGGNQGGTSSSKYHVVQEGDTLWGISRKYGVSVDRLIERNGIEDKNRIYVGQKINL